jgi:mRNA-degrading endonuclease RelE of RelBE toxin-antitoxin system
VYEIIWSDEAIEDLEQLHVRHQRVMGHAAEELRFQPGAPPTRHRKPLEAPVSELGVSPWELQVGPFRLFYSIDEGALTVTVLRAILKGRLTTAEALRRSRRS